MKNIKDIIGYFFKNDFSEETTSRTQKYIVQHKDEQAKNEALEQIWSDIGLPDTQDGAQRDYAVVKEKIMRRQQCKIVPLSVRLTRYAAVLTLMIISAGLSIYLYDAVKTPKTISYVEHFASSGERLRVVLPDNSIVWLNSGTILIHPEKFTGNQRDVFLSGEAHFDVEKDEKAQFVVRTKHISVKVFGTSFNVNAYPDSKEVKTSLESGSVVVYTEDGQEQLTLRPNELLTYDSAQKKATIKPVTNAENLSKWISGSMVFNSETFDSIMRTIERKFNIHIFVQNSAYYTNRLTLSIDENEPIERVLHLIKNIVPEIEYQLNDGNVYIK